MPRLLTIVDDHGVVAQAGLVYTLRRVDCRRCGVVAVGEVPWGDGKRTLTKACVRFLARWARALSWKGTAGAFR
jgi:hypothetical protein